MNIAPASIKDLFEHIGDVSGANILEVLLCYSTLRRYIYVYSTLLYSILLFYTLLYSLISTLSYRLL